MKPKEWLTIFFHALVGWALCAASMGMDMAVTTQQNALVIHAIAAPIIFTLVSLVYFTRFHYTTPLQTAAFFVAFVILTDFFGVALLINRSLEMFASLLGTWIPFALIFTSTLLTGWLVSRRAKRSVHPMPYHR